MNTTTLEKAPTQPRLNYPQAAPRTLHAMLALSEVVKTCGLEPSLLHLIETRASQINGCAFCIDMHIRDARAAGETEERINLLTAWREVEIYAPRERAALAWTERLTRLADAHVTDEDFIAAKKEFTEEELANLTLAIVMINGWNRFNVGFRVPPGFGG